MKLELGDWKHELQQDHVVALILMLIIWGGVKLWGI